MRTLEQTSNIVEATCQAIEKKLKGRANLNQDQIIANQCKTHDISESHIRKILMIDENSRSSVRLRERIE